MRTRGQDKVCEAEDSRGCQDVVGGQGEGRGQVGVGECEASDVETLTDDLLLTCPV